MRYDLCRPGSRSERFNAQRLDRIQQLTIRPLSSFPQVREEVVEALMIST